MSLYPRGSRCIPIVRPLPGSPVRGIAAARASTASTKTRPHSVVVEPELTCAVLQRGGPPSRRGCPGYSREGELANVDVDHFDRVVSVAEPVPDRRFGLGISGDVCRAGAEAVAAGLRRDPLEGPVLPLVRAFRGLEMRREPVRLAGEADVDVGHRARA